MCIRNGVIAAQDRLVALVPASLRNRSRKTANLIAGLPEWEVGMAFRLCINTRWGRRSHAGGQRCEHHHLPDPK